MQRRSFLKTALAATGAAALASCGSRPPEDPALAAGAAPIDRLWDVVICGGGPAGIMAAWAAALEGAACLLIEEQPILGGMATSGLVGPMSKFRFDEKLIVGGLPWRFASTLKTQGGAVLDLPTGNVPFEADVYAAAAEQTLAHAGVAVLLRAGLTAATCGTDGQVESVVVRRAGRALSIRARMFVDATGRGDLVCRTPYPAPLRAGPDELQPMSLIFRLDHVDTGAITVWMARDRTRYSQPQLREALQTAMAGGRIRLFGGPWAVFGSTIRPGSVSVNATRCVGDATDPSVREKAREAMAAEIPVMVEIFREAHPAFEKCRLRDVAALVGVRESRGIVGRHILSDDDVRSGRLFDDTVALGGHPLDMHNAKDAGQQAPFLDHAYSIPYRCLVPERSRNLLVAGGLVSADRTAYSSARVQAQCMATGQAAGAAAALCARLRIGPTDLKPAVLQDRLRAEGAILA